MKTVRLFSLVVTVALFLPVASHASELIRTHPEFTTKKSAIRSIVLLPPHIYMYEIGAGGTLEKMEDWGAAAQANVSQALEARKSSLQLTRLDEQVLGQAVRDNYDETLLLYEEVRGSIVMHAYDYQRPWHFPAKARDFVYSLGADVQKIAPEADAFLLIEGFDQRTSAGHKALQVGTALIGAVLGVVAIPRGGANLMTVSLVEAKTGTVLWFYRTTYAYDLRDTTSAVTFVEDILKELPPVEK